MDDAITHFLYLLENIQRCMGEDVYQLVWILDVSGKASGKTQLTHAIYNHLLNYTLKKTPFSSSFITMNTLLIFTKSKISCYQAKMPIGRPLKYNILKTIIIILNISVSGLTMSACNPRLAYGVSQVLSNHYPERLGLAYVINHSAVMHALWKACAVVVPAASRNKTHVLRGKHNIEEAFSAVFSDELKNWLYEETRLNKQHPIPQSQKTFWQRPPEGVTHDPRGCPSYVSDYVEKFSVEEYKNNKYICKPHPNILDTILHPSESPDNNNLPENP